METTHTQTHARAVESNMGVVRKRKANKYLLTQQKWRRAGHSWKQKAEDEERRARKPVGRRPCAPLVLEWKTRGRRRRGKSREDGTLFQNNDFWNHYFEFWDDCCFHIYVHKRIWDLKGNLTHPVPAKGLNFAVSPEEVAVVDLI